MATQTTNYGLTKPDRTEKYDISVRNANWDKIDAQMKANADAVTTAQATAESKQDQIIVSTTEPTVDDLEEGQFWAVIE